MMKYPREESRPPTPDGRPFDEQPKWRRDFPIDWPQTDYVTRRDFTRFMALISGAFAVGQFWIVFQNWRRGRRGEEPIREIARIDDVAVGAAVVFAYPTEHESCLLVRTGDREWVAYGQECTHLACAVIPEIEAGRLRCPCHHGYFDLASGRPTAGPPRRPLIKVNLEFRNGSVFATGVEART